MGGKPRGRACVICDEPLERKTHDDRPEQLGLFATAAGLRVVHARCKRKRLGVKHGGRQRR